MEELLDFVSKVQPSEDLIKACRMHVMTVDDFRVFNELKDDWRLHLKISIEYDVLYDKLYIGSYNSVPDDFKRMFLTLSFYKVSIIINFKNSFQYIAIFQHSGVWHLKNETR
jgi:hypothetical protein